MKDILIRPLESKDAEQYIDLANLVWRVAYKDIFTDVVFEWRESKRGKMIETLAQNVKNGGDSFNYVAEYDGKIIGFVSGMIGTKYEYFNDEQNYAEFGGMYIHPDYQGMGIGSRFKSMFVEWAKQKGIKKLGIGVLKDNKHARMIYEKWGGKLEDCKLQSEIKGEKYEEVFYTYDLQKM